MDFFKKQKFKNLRNFERFRLGDLAGAQVELSDLRDPETGRPFDRKLFNLSYKGLGFYGQSGDEALIPFKKPMPALLRLPEEIMPIEIEVLYSQDGIFGAKLSVFESRDIGKIIRFIRPLELGLSLQAIRPEAVFQKDPSRLISWYVGRNHSELVLWRDRASAKLLEFKMVFLLYSIVWRSSDHHLETADVNPTELGYLPIYEPWPEDAAHRHPEPDLEILGLAQELLSRAPNLSTADRTQITQILADALSRGSFRGSP